MRALQDELASLLAGRYAVERELGRGGMATVFLALDTKHRRNVALKVLHPELSVSVGPERFLREIEIAASLSHPHILPLHDSGEAGGYLYYVMPFFEGESLRDRLDRARPLPLAEVLAIARDVASALGYAHSRQVVHRDIKPDNILLAGGEAVVADFGIAKAVGFVSSVTQPGLAIGSPIYMSPEQAMGESDLDGRSDLYSLGCVLFELLAGEPPFVGDNALSVMARHTSDPPPPLRARRPEVPEHLERVVMTLLQKRAADRFVDARQLLDALESPEAALKLTVARHSVPMPAPRPTGTPAAGSLAVLPFRDLSPGRDQEYLCDGIAEDVLGTLARIPGLRVASRMSAFAYKGRQLDVRTIGRELQVAAVLEGSVQRVGDRLRINVELSGTADGFQIWSERYARQFDDVFAIQEEIATSIADSLRVTLTGSGGRVVVKRHTDNLQAYELYLRGRHFWSRRHEGGLQQALECYQKSLEADPLYPLPYAGLADAMHALAGYEFIPTAGVVPRIMGLAAKAVELDPELPEPRATLGAATAHYLWKWAEGEAELRASLALDDRYAMGHFWLAQARLAQGDIEGALAGTRQAIALDPLNMPANAVLGWTYAMARRYDEAVGHLDQVIRVAPDLPLAQAILGTTHLMAGRADQALPFLEKGAAMPGASAVRALTLHRLGRPADAEQVMTEAKSRASGGWVSPFGVALLQAGLGERTAALDALERAAVESSFQVSFIGVHPLLDPLRGEPRFLSLLERVGVGQPVRP